MHVEEHTLTTRDASPDGERTAVESPLNPFQRTMLLWERLHPYNAAHVICWEGEFERERLTAAIRSACDAAGVGLLEADAGRKIVRYTPARDVAVTSEDATGGVRASVAHTIVSQLNQPFAAEPHHPIRWTIIRGGLREHALVAVYHHVASDASGMEGLLGDIFRCYAGETALCAATVSTQWPAQLSATSVPGVGGMMRNVARTVALYFKLRMSHKMPDEKLAGDRTELALLPAERVGAPRLVAACKRRGVGLNDAFLAALASAIARATPDRLVSRHRRRIALGSAVSARRMLGAASEQFFGTLVGDMLVRIARPDEAFDAVLSQVAARTRSQKCADWAAAMATSAARAFCIESIWPLFRVPHSRRSYRKTFPVCGGVSTFVAKPQRFGPASPVITADIRACPPGPAMPLVLAPTVCGERLELSLVFREACMNQQGGEALLNHVGDVLTEFVDSSGA